MKFFNKLTKIIIKQINKPVVKLFVLIKLSFINKYLHCFHSNQINGTSKIINNLRFK